LRLAARGRYRTSPNPMVGALVVRDGAVVGRGWHQRVGGAHAEVEALAAAKEQAAGATLYVSLEPCAHHGRTPPCAEAIVAAGIRRVVACHRDPDPRVRGRGFARLRDAGLEVEEGILVEAAVRLNLKYLVATTGHRPAVTLKWAMSLDGKIATVEGASQWISSLAARRWALALREEHDAVIVGSGTVLADNPRLDRRLGLAEGRGYRVVLDRRLRIPPAARLFGAEGPVLIYCETPAAAKKEALERVGARVVALPRVAPPTVLSDLYRRGVRSVLVEGGARVLASFAESGLYDEIAAACAPRLLGGAAAPGALGGDGLGSLTEAPYLEHLVARRRGPDLIVGALRAGCLAELLAAVA
jgi:diaminohydroxyphosphoribosylaminopyrimidine deaminase/5-amino-6-(5-phosphoribosylamino)uracil reductase